jgi:integrase
MPIRWDTRNKRWRYEFDRVVDGRRHRLSRLLPSGWSQAQADAYDIKETGRLWAVASGLERRDPMIDEAVVLYLRDKTALKSYRSAAEHLAAIAWAYTGKPLSELPAVADRVCQEPVSAATNRNRLALLKAACRWAWKRHGLTDADPTARMRLPAVRNERHVYIGRGEMLRLCRACTNWQAQIAVRVAFYAGLRLGEILNATGSGGAIVIEATKNGDRRAIPAHPRIRHLLRFLPLPGPKITIQRAFERARERVGLGHVHFHDLRHSAASEMVNAGVPLYTVGQVLGHRDSRSTARYSHLTHDTLAAAVGKIGSKVPHTGGKGGIRTLGTA